MCAEMSLVPERFHLCFSSASDWTFQVPSVLNCRPPLFWSSVFLHHMWALVVVMHRLTQPLFCKRWTEKKSYFEEKWNWDVFRFKKSLNVNWLNLAFVKTEHSCKCQPAAFWVSAEIRHIAQKSLPPRFPFRQEGVTLHVSCPIPSALATFRLLSWC